MGEFNSYKKHTQAPKIQYTGLFDFKKVYGTVMGMYSQKAFLTTEKKNIQKAGGSGIEIEIEIYGYRNETEYVQLEITSFLHAWDVTDVEVVIDGKKKTLQKGRIMIDFEVKINTDYAGEFESTPFLKKMKKLYQGPLMGKNLWIGYEDRFYYESYKFHAAVKEALDMYSGYNAF